MKKMIYFLMDITGTRKEIQQEIYSSTIQDVSGRINDFGYWFNERREISDLLHCIAHNLKNYGTVGDMMALRQQVYDHNKKPKESPDRHPEHTMD